MLSRAADLPSIAQNGRCRPPRPARRSRAVSSTTTEASSASTGGAPPSAANPAELLRSRSYLLLLAFGAILGVPIAASAYFFLKAVAESQHFVFTTLPTNLGLDSEPTWWPMPVLALGGLVVGLAILHLPGGGGHSPADGFKPSGPVPPRNLPGIGLAAFATLTAGAVVGPEAPLIAIGSGLAVLCIEILKRDAPKQAIVVIAASGSFAAISTLFGSPLPAAFLLMEVSGVGGPMLGVLLVPGLLAAGIGSLIYVGLDNVTGFGTFSLAIPNLAPSPTPTIAECMWAVPIGILAAVVGTAIRRLAVSVRGVVARRIVVLTPVVGLAVGGLAFVFAEGSTHGSEQVLFSGQDALAPLVQNSADWTVGALLLLIACKGLAYALSLSSFRGGPVFPSLFIGAAGGIALAHLPGLPTIAGAAMGMGAMSAAVLGLPLTSVMLVAVFLQATGLALVPPVIIAVVTAFVATARLPPVVTGEKAAEAGPRT
jgi:H+/Cl- antiporter ClcA